MSETILDVKGMRCPMPVLRASKALKQLGNGDTLIVWATDRQAPRDFKSYCEESGNQFLGVEETEPDVFKITLQRCC